MLGGELYNEASSHYRNFTHCQLLENATPDSIGTRFQISFSAPLSKRVELRRKKGILRVRVNV
jgi:hypothetical protein